MKTASVSHQSVAGYGGQDMTHVEFLVKWMNANVLKNQLEHFPQDLVTTGGRHIYEMIEFLSGKTVPQGAGGKAVQREDKKGSRHGNKSKEMQVINQQIGRAHV